MSKNYEWSEIEQPAGPALAPSVDMGGIDARRQAAYRSFESFLHDSVRRMHADRQQQWKRDYSSVDAYARSVEPMRARFKELLGWWIDPKDRAPVRAEENAEVLLEQREFVARRFSLELTPALATYAIELIPNTPAPSGGRRGLLVQHGYCGTPELACGLTSGANRESYSYRSLGVRAVKRGYHVVAVHHPAAYGSHDDEITRPLDRFANMPDGYGQNRLHRLALLHGRTLFGLYMLASSRGIDVLASRADVDPTRIGMYGLSQGGQSTVFLPALDTRIRAAVASAWFNSRLEKTIGPATVTCYLDWQDESSIFPKLLQYFSDSDIVSLTAPRAFAVEAGTGDTAVDIDRAYDEFQAARTHYDRLGVPDRIEFIPHREGHCSATRRAFEFLDQHLR